MKPQINVTPLIDVLLVLLIIFMVISPLKPSKFEVSIPAELKSPIGEEHSLALVIRIGMDSTLALNRETNLGTLDDPNLLLKRLNEVFKERTRNNVIDSSVASSDKLTSMADIQKTVFVKAPRSLKYGRVVYLIDIIKLTGANPIGLQIDNID